MRPFYGRDMSTTHGSNPTGAVDGQADQLRRLEAEVSELRSIVETLRRSTPTEHGSAEDTTDEPAVSSRSRRDLLRLAGAGAAVGTVAAAAAGARPAAAIDPNDLELGSLLNSTAAVTNTTYTGGAVSSAIGFQGSLGIIGLPTGMSNPTGLITSEVGTTMTNAMGVSTQDTRGNALNAHNYGEAGTAVTAESNVGTAIIGTSVNDEPSDPRGIGVIGIANGTGVVGTGSQVLGDQGYGVRGNGRIGVAGSGTGYAFAAEDGEKAQVHLATVTGAAVPRTAPAERLDDHERGEIEPDGDGNLWYCVESGVPGVWRKLTGLDAAGSFHAVVPYRAFDTRRPIPSPGKLDSTALPRVVGISSQRDNITGATVATDLVPVGATAVAYNITVVETEDRGNLTVAPGDATEASASTINWDKPNAIVANSAIVGLDDQRRIKVFNNTTIPSATHFVIDISGYFL